MVKRIYPAKNLQAAGTGLNKKKRERKESNNKRKSKNGGEK